MATTLPAPDRSSAAATEVKASPASCATIADWQAFNTTQGTA